MTAAAKISASTAPLLPASCFRQNAKMASATISGNVSGRAQNAMDSSNTQTICRYDLSHGTRPRNTNNASVTISICGMCSHPLAPYSGINGKVSSVAAVSSATMIEEE